MLTEAKKLRNQTLKLLDERAYETLKSLLEKELSAFESEKKKDIFVLVEIAGAYISLGSESYDKDCVDTGLRIFKDSRNTFTGKVTESSIEYCIANGHHALHKIATRDQERWYITPESVKGSLFDAKQSYLKSFKLLDLKKIDDFSIQVLTNLANNLNDSGRIVEALQLFDFVLQHNPDFPQALISKADGLRILIQATRCGLTPSLFVEMYSLYQRALKQNPAFPEDIESLTQYRLQQVIRILNENNIAYEQVEHEFELNQKEYEAHSEELKFYLDNFLSLSEHSLYCKCNAAKAEDLFIGYPGLNVSNHKIAELEHILNRIKSEFAFARRQLFEFRSSKTEDLVCYQDFGVHKLIYGVQSEKLRISFRMCFGILDKIAHGILHLFDLEKVNNENIYFESFWRSPRAPKERWEKFNEESNIHLTALYSIACDLSNHNGEFNFYKKWRNQLEHDMFTLIPPNAEGQDILESDLFSESITIDEFNEKALHILQLVRAAIYSFAFCCREKLVNNNN